MALNAVLAKANCNALSELSRVECGSTHDSQPKVPTNMHTPYAYHPFFSLLFF